MMKLPLAAPDGQPWNEAALIRLGATKISDKEDGLELEPDVDLSQYAGALVGSSKAELAFYANAKQWALATGGFSTEIAGVALTFPTDPMSQGFITGKAVRLAQPNPPANIDWQFSSGFVTVSAANFLAAAAAIADFIQGTFDALNAVLAAIAVGSITSTAQIDGWAWPPNHA